MSSLRTSDPRGGAPPLPRPGARLTLTDETRVQVSGGKAVAVHLASARSFVLNPSAVAVMGHLHDRPRFDALVERVRAELVGAQPPDLAQQIGDLVHQFAAEGLVHLDDSPAIEVRAADVEDRWLDDLTTESVDRRTRRRIGHGLVQALAWDGEGAPPAPTGPLHGIALRAAVHGITGYVHRAYAGRGLLDAAEEARLDRLHHSAVRNHLLVLEDLRALVPVLADEGIDPVVVKGPALAERLHAHPDLRAYGDLDLLVHGHQLETAIEALTRSGAQVLDRNWTLLRRRMSGQVHLRLRWGTTLDLHWNLINESSTRHRMGIPTEELIASARRSSLGEARVRTLDPEHTLLHLCQHAVLSGMNRLIWFKDIALAATVEGLAWDRVATVAHANGLELVLDSALSTVRHRLGDLEVPATPPVGRQARVWGAAVATAAHVAAPERSEGDASPLRILARSTRASLPASLVALGRKLAHVAARPTSALDHPRTRAVRNPADHRSAAYRSGEDGDRSAYLATVARDGPPRGRGGRGRRVLIIVQNLPVRTDRRVWQECQALLAAGYQVSVICPRGSGDPRHAVVDGVVVRTYAPAPATEGALSFAVEFAYCWVRTALLSTIAAVREGFDVIQACNPPDTYFALAALYKPFGKRFVYDQHDLCPELYRSRFNRDDGLLLKGLGLLESATYRVADHVITPNESYRHVATTRGRRHLDDVTVVRSGPDLRRFVARRERPELRHGRAHLACYVGVMGPQDGVDRAVRAVAHYVHVLGRRDCHFAFLGGGDVFEELVALARELDVEEWTTFTGMVGDDVLLDHLSTAVLGICPDPRTPLNDVSTMNKILEYMAIGLPTVGFDLTESRVSAGDAAVYVTSDDIPGFAEAIADLVDDPSRRERMGELGRQRVRGALAWEHQIPHYVGVYDRLLARRAHAPR